MAVETIYNASYTSPTNTGRQEYTDVGASNFALYLEGEGGTAPIGFKDSTIAVYDVAVGGTALVKGTDYVTEIESEYHTARAGYSVKYRVRAITHQSGSIYIDCDIVAQEIAAEVVNELQSGITTNVADIATNTSAISALSASIFPGIYNCELSNGTDTDHDIDIATGFCYDSSLTYNMTLSSGLTKQLDATWAVGTNAGGLFSGTVANSTTYHTFLIRKDSDSSIDAGFDTSVTAANIPSGYTAYKRLGSVITDGSANIIQFIHTWQDKTFMKVTKTVLNSWQVPTDGSPTTLDVPLGISVKPIGLMTPGLSSSGTNLVFEIYNHDETPVTIAAQSAGSSTFNATSGHLYSTSDTSVFSHPTKIIEFKTNTSGQLYIRRSGTYFSANYYSTLQIRGYVDYTL